MDTLTLLTTRRSSKSLTLPAPDELELESILQAGTQVPDHGNLKPWRFVVIQSEEGRQRFAHTLQQVAMDDDLSPEKAKAVAKMAPMVIAVIHSPHFHSPKPKPEWEQMLSAGCSAYAMQLAAKAQGFDSAWITGLWVHAQALRQAFQCEEQEKIIALLMIGTATTPPDNAKNCDVSQFATFW